MSTANILTLASASDIKALVSAGTATADDAIIRVDEVLARKSLSDGKKARWVRLREWLVKEQSDSTKGVA
jgi:hypothetical protein